MILFQIIYSQIILVLYLKYCHKINNFHNFLKLKVTFRNYSVARVCHFEMAIKGIYTSRQFDLIPPLILNRKVTLDCDFNFPMLFGWQTVVLIYLFGMC